MVNDQKLKTENQKSLERKELLRWNKKPFLSFLKESQTWECVPLSKLSDVVKYDVVKNVVYNAKTKKYWR